MNRLARLDVDRRNGSWVVTVRGEIDLSNAADVAAEIEGSVAGVPQRLVVDLSETAYLDSAGVRLMLVLAARLAGRRQELRLVVPFGAPIRPMVDLAGLAKAIGVYEDVGQALA